MHVLAIVQQLIQSCCPDIHAALLLIALLALFVLLLIGQQALAQGLHLHYQNNTRRTRPLLSVFNLACQLVRHTIDFAIGRDLPVLKLPDRLPLPPRIGL